MTNERDDEILGRALSRAIETLDAEETPYESSRIGVQSRTSWHAVLACRCIGRIHRARGRAGLDPLGAPGGRSAGRYAAFTDRSREHTSGHDDRTGTDSDAAAERDRPRPHLLRARWSCAGQRAHLEHRARDGRGQQADLPPYGRIADGERRNAAGRLDQRASTARHDHVGHRREGHRRQRRRRSRRAERLEGLGVRRHQRACAADRLHGDRGAGHPSRAHHREWRQANHDRSARLEQGTHARRRLRLRSRERRGHRGGTVTAMRCPIARARYRRS